MIKEGAGIKRVLIFTGRVDLRRGISGLSALVRLSYGLDPLEEGTVFLFCGKKKDRIRGLLFEGIGFCLFSLRLSNGRFCWPNNPDEAKDITLEQYRRLMEGFPIESSIRSYVRNEEEKNPQKSGNIN